MVKPTPELARFEERYAREIVGSRSYLEALKVFTSLWSLARRLQPDYQTPWMEDLAPDLELARVLNGLPGNA